jgi:hypothetical protein
LAKNGQRLGFWIAPFWIPDKLSPLFEEHKASSVKKARRVCQMQFQVEVREVRGFAA